MNSNKLKNNALEISDIKEISEVICDLKSNDEVYSFLFELLCESELFAISKRWRILNMLNIGFSQREIAKELNVSLCKVTRGAKIIKDKNAVITKILKNKENKNE